ncbi:MAG: hypothetical protein EBZ48_07615 [Proteobacteria bacterium]|nr:hypothetical protein [Pseudomonadota bacterium]
MQEGISVRAFDVILQAVAEHGPKSGNERILFEEVRIALRRMVSHTIAPTAGSCLSAVMLSPIIDLQLSKNERERSAVDMTLIDQIALYVQQNPGDWVLLTSRSARRITKEFLALKGISKTVVANEEIVPELKYELIGIVDLDAVADSERVVARLAA